MTSGRPLPDPSGKARRAYERAMRRGRDHSKPKDTIGPNDLLPCGCRAMGHALVIGVLGRPIPAVVEVTPSVGRLRMMRFAYLGELQRNRMHGPADVALIDVDMPFALLCRTHGLQAQTTEATVPLASRFLGGMAIG